MLSTIVSVIGQILLIFVMLTAIVCLIAVIFSVISGIKEIHQQNKIKSEQLKQLQKDFIKLVQELDKQKLKKE